MSDAPASIIDSAPRQSKVYDPRKKRHPLCRAFDIFLESILQDQASDKSYVAEAMRHEFGESVTASVMQAAGIRKLRNEHELRSRAHGLKLKYGTQEATIATEPEFIGVGG